MPPVGKDKRKEVKKANKRKSLSFVQKKELFSRILKEKEKWLYIDIANKKLSNQKKDRGAKFPEIESALYLWMQQVLASNLTITAGEANSAPLETLEEEHVALQKIIEQYDLHDVYNVDETEPSKILSDHDISGTKNQKIRLQLF
ncbi:hypothetical protein RIR_jg34837.t1 [Rhizophagus irregularis DAOM 181602=DAOM 197198]|nr:hypothetical protein RIR_jg34837.t1 [Rhizophagus irregularis DAOM 181602=DAOM 197198]